MGGGGRVFTPKYNVLVHCTYLRKKYYIFKRVFSVRKGIWNGMAKADRKIQYVLH